MGLQCSSTSIKSRMQNKTMSSLLSIFHSSHQKSEKNSRHDSSKFVKLCTHHANPQKSKSNTLFHSPFTPQKITITKRTHQRHTAKQFSSSYFHSPT